MVRHADKLYQYVFIDAGARVGVAQAKGRRCPVAWPCLEKTMDKKASETRQVQRICRYRSRDAIKGKQASRCWSKEPPSKAYCWCCCYDITPRGQRLLPFGRVQKTQKDSVALALMMAMVLLLLLLRMGGGVEKGGVAGACRRVVLLEMEWYRQN